MSLALILATGIAIGGFNGVLDGVDWWFVVAGATLLVFLAGAIARATSKRAWAPLAASVGVAIITTVLFFSADKSILGIIPTLDTIDRIDELVQAGTESIYTQGIPARPVTGIVFLFTTASMALAISIDSIALTLRRPALAGIPLFLLLATPSLIDSTLVDPFFFLLEAFAYLLILFLASDRRQGGSALAIGAIAVSASLVASIFLPPVLAEGEEGVRAAGYATGINPIVSLGDDLRRGAPITAMTYTTNSTQSQYFTLSVLDNFTGANWEARVPEEGNGNLGEFGRPRGRSNDLPITTSETDITLGNIQGRWLPVPYAPRAVDGLVGEWFWDPETLTVRTVTSNMRAQKYTVVSEEIEPTREQLEAAGTTVPSTVDDKFLAVPEDLPAIVQARAESVVAGAESNFDKALALQAYFRGSEFTYSLDAPVEDGYDGTSGDVIAAFLDAKSGYCVHFSSAMATMARTLGIPARIAVGFTSGEAVRDTEARVTRFTVTTDELHAWPELYFDRIGWVRFEPTKSRGSVPDFPSAPVDDPATPENEASPTPTPTPTSTGAATPIPQDDPSQAAPGQTVRPANVLAIVGSLLALVVLLALFAPAVIRSARHRSRVTSVLRDGSALAAWAEFVDTARDLGRPLPESLTPRQAADAVRAGLDERAVDALRRLQLAVEAEAYAASVPEGRATLVNSLRTVTRALRKSVGWKRRLRARVLPASVLTQSGVPRFAWLAPLYRQD